LGNAAGNSAVRPGPHIRVDLLQQHVLHAFHLSFIAAEALHELHTAPYLELSLTSDPSIDDMRPPTSSCCSVKHNTAASALYVNMRKTTLYPDLVLARSETKRRQRSTSSI